MKNLFRSYRTYKSLLFLLLLAFYLTGPGPHTEIEAKINKGETVSDPDRNPLGLLFAGSMDGKWAIANPIEPVLQRFGVIIDGE